ncbi:MAG: leucine-rich repeat protein, partial [Oscillospiraceae bacterium]
MKKRTIKTISVFLVLLMIFSSVPLDAGLISFAEEELSEVNNSIDSGVCGAQGDNVIWEIFENGTLVLSGQGAMANYDYWDGERSPYGNYSYYGEDYEYEEGADNTVKNVIIEDGVTSIGDEAFRFFIALESVTIPDSVTSIGDSAFRGCTSIASVIINNADCLINNYAIPSSVEIHGYNYSAAYDYAISNGNAFVSIGESKELENISISSMPNKTTYKQGASFKQDGLSITVYFSDGTSTEKTTGFTVNGFASEEVGICTLTVTYGDKTATFDVEITEYVEPIIHAGETINVEVEEGCITYIKFVPIVSGTFTFTSISEDDTYGYLYDADKNEITHNDDSDEDNYNFSITYDLEAGQTYYFGARYYSSDRSGSFDVKLTCDEVFCAHENTTSHEAVEATCTEDGYTAGVYCEDCQTWISGHEIIRRYHTDSDEDGICEICGEKALVDSGVCGAQGDNVIWELYENGTLVISGQGVMANYDYWEEDGERPPYGNYLYYGEDYEYEEGADNTVKNVIIEDGVTSIGDEAFRFFIALESVTISGSVTSIGYAAFRNCTNLTSIAIPESVTTIGSYAFYNCTDMTSIIINNADCLINNYAIPSIVEIHGYNYSTAYDYAIANGNAFVSIGESKELENISISSMPNKTTYKQGASFKQDGLSITVYFSDGTSTEKTTGFTVNGFASEEVGICTLTVTYGDKTATFDVEITEYVEPIIHAGETINVEVEEGCITYIKFVPIVSGTFTFTSISEDDTYGYLYDADKNEITHNDDSDEDNYNFSITYDLEAGQTYYFGARYYSSDRSGSFDVKLTCDEVFCVHENTTSHEAVEATCTENGYTAGVYCEDCQTWISGHEVIKAHHTYVQNEAICDVCGEERPVKLSGSCGEEIYEDDGEGEGCFVKFSDNVTFTLYEDGTLVISGTGRMGCFGVDSPDAPYADESFKNVVIKDGVTSIGWFAFNGCSGLTSVTIPDSVTNIDDSAFEGCTGLASIIIPDSVTSIGGSAFEDCTGLTSMTIPDSVTSIDSDAFRGCTGLTSITIPESVTAIGSGAFYNCETLTNIAIPDSVTSIGYAAFRNCTNLTSITIPDSVTSVGEYAFYNTAWYNAQPDDVYAGKVYYKYKGTMIDNIQIIIKDGTKSISDSAFYGCSDLTSITIPDSVTSIGGSAFSGCTSLTSITIPDSVTSIGNMAFQECSGLTSVTIGNGVTSIGGDAFSGCTGLTQITWNAESVSDFSKYDSVFYNAGTAEDGIEVIFGDNVKNIPANAFYVYISSYTPNIKSVTIGNSVTSIGSDAFRNCTGLTNITIPDSVTSIGGGAFSGCTGLTQITWNAESVSDFDYSSNVFYNAGTAGDGIEVIFGDNVKNIPSYAFYVSNSSYTPNIKSVTIGNSVTSIGSDAFRNCTGLTSITIPDSVTSIGGSAFSGCDSLQTVYVYSNNLSLNGCGLNSTVEIHAHVGSSAQSFASDNGNPFVPLEEVESIAVATMPNKTKYKQGYDFKQDGLTISVDYSDGTSETISNGFMIAGFDSSAPGACTLTVTYGGKTTTFDVEIIEYTDPIINKGETINVSIEKNEITYIKFVPTVTETYELTSVSSSDTYGYLYDSDKNLITSDDDSGNGYNFSLKYKMEAGKTYYYGVRFYNSSNEGSFDVRLDHVHLYDVGTVTIEPTCTEQGEKIFTCSECGETKTEKISALGHDYGDWKTTIEATCTTYGTEESTCSRCSNTGTRTISALGHDMSEDEQIKAPTCTETGMKKSTCSRCDYYETRTISALGHDYVFVQTVPCTCTTEGEDIYKCLRCNVEYSKKFAARHSDADDDGFCDFCNEPYVGVLDLVFVIDTTGSMGGEISVVKQNITNYANRLANSNIPYYIAVVDYRDFADRAADSDYPYSILFDFTNNNDEILSGVNKLSLGNGGDTEETVYSGLVNGLDELHWGDNSVRKVILIGDAAPLDPEPNTNLTLDSTCEYLNNKDISVYTISTGGGEVMAFTEIAESTGGESYVCSSDKAFNQVLTDIIDSIPESLHIHTYEENYTDATCIQGGITTYHCTGCGKDISTETEPLGHDYSTEWTIDKQPTCTEAG